MVERVHAASTRGCAITGIIGVPVGTHTDVLINVATGVPPASTRSAPTMNWPLTQGGVDVLASAQPAMT
jgi:hypothetical protein